jgi:exopolysaccharide biosynthesis polyprenyl glycosylphosphotransferase
VTQPFAHIIRTATEQAAADAEAEQNAAAAAEQEWLRYVQSLQARGQHHVRRFRISFSFRAILAAMVGDFAFAMVALFLAARLTAAGSYTWGRWAAEGAVLLVLLNQFGGYERRRLLRSRPAVASALRAGIAWLLICPGACVLLWPTSILHRSQLLLGGALATAFVAAWRALFPLGLKRTVIAQRLHRRILFLGWSENADRLAMHLRDHEGDCFEIIGRLSLGAEQAPANVACPECQSALASEEDLDLLLSQDVADIVIASGTEASQHLLLRYANLCEKWMIDFRVIPSCFEILVSGLSLENIGGTPLLGVSRLPLDSTLNLVLKRAVDIVGGLVGLFLSAPLIVVFGLLIFLEEKRGPIFFAQERYGRKGRKFRMYKLRSMRVGSEKSDHLNQSTLRVDPRVLRVGGFMRKYNIDEVPQFWNVVRGDMSLVGPRPERTYHSELLSDQIAHYNARYNIHPGITGWAQVNGLRGDTDLTDRVKCDLYYIENWSLWLDFKIMVRTFLKNKNAY